MTFLSCVRIRTVRAEAVRQGFRSAREPSLSMRLLGLALVVSGSMAAGASLADPPARGHAVYEAACLACHGADGAGAFPSVPDLTEAGGVLSKPDDVLMENMINGIQSPDSPMPMPAKGGDPSLTEEDIRAVLRYMRAAFGS